jgi:iron complex outermembrane receptor protein
MDHQFGRFKPIASARVAWVVLGAAVGTAQAQEPPAAGDSALEEVVVTAQFRREPLQSTPIAITAVSGEQLEARAISNVTDLSAVVPNLLSAQSTHTFGPMSQILLRGVGQFDGHPGFEPGVGVYIDDIYRGLSLGSALTLVDLDRVEVLRGPQGTLSGKNSIGGSIKLFSKKPRERTDGYLAATYGDFNRVELRAAGNFTLVPNKAYVRLSGMSKHVDGYMKRLDYACLHPGSTVPTQISVSPGCEIGTQGGQDVQGIRVALRWVGSDTFEDNLILDATRDRSEVPAAKLLFVNNPLIPGGGAQFITGPEDYTTYSTFSNLGFTDPARYTTPTAQPGAGTHGAIYLPDTNPTDGYGVSNGFEWRLADNYSFNFITGYRRDSGQYSIFYGGSPYTIQLLHNTWSNRQFTQELRLNGNLGGHVDWTVGGFYYDQQAFFGGLKLLSPGAATETLFTGSDPIPATSKSAFIHAVWHVTPKLSAITGVRYTDEEKNYTFERKNPFVQSLPSYTPVGVLDGTTGSYSGSRGDYRAGAEYEWTSTFMTYGQWSTGFRGGGVNPRPFIVQQEVPYGPEKMQAFEIGAKTELLDRRLRVNGAVFYNKYKDILFNNTAPTVMDGVVLSANNSTPVNAGDATIQGAELEISARLAGSLQIDAALSYLDFEFTRISAPGATIPGVTLATEEPFAPKRKASIGLSYELAFGTFGKLIPRADASFQSKFFTDISNSPDGLVDGRTLVNAHLIWESPSEDWEADFAVTNLTDKFYYVNKFRVAPPTNITEGQPGRPREWMVAIKRKF